MNKLKRNKISSAVCNEIWRQRLVIYNESWYSFPLLKYEMISEVINIFVYAVTFCFLVVSFRIIKILPSKKQLRSTKPTQQYKNTTEK